MICNRISEDSSKVAIVLMLRGASSQSQGARGTAGRTVASMLWFDEQCFFHGWAEKDVTEYDEVSHILVPCNILETCTILQSVQQSWYNWSKFVSSWQTRQTCRRQPVDVYAVNPDSFRRNLTVNTRSAILDVIHSGRLIRVLLFQKSLNIIVLVLWQSSFPCDMGRCKCPWTSSRKRKKQWSKNNKMSKEIQFSSNMCLIFIPKGRNFLMDKWFRKANQCQD